MLEAVFLKNTNMDEDQTCPRCKTSKFRNPSMKLMVNVCGHPLCETCVNLLFAKGSGTCVQCDTPLRRSGFRVQLYEDSHVEKDLDIRRRILREYNKQEHDFQTLREYNDYLEEVETIIYNLVNELDVLETNKKIEAYKRDNKETIARNRGCLREEQEELQEILHVERQQEQERREQETCRQRDERNSREQRKQALIDELSTSHGNARAIIAQHSRSRPSLPAAPPAGAGPEGPSRFSSGVRIGSTQVVTAKGAAPPAAPQGELYRYVAPEVVTDGPEAPSSCQLQRLGYLKHIRAASDTDRAGGFTTELGCLRALQEALAGLLYFQQGIDGTTV